MNAQPEIQSEAWDDESAENKACDVIATALAMMSYAAFSQRAGYVLVLTSEHDDGSRIRSMTNLRPEHASWLLSNILQSWAIDGVEAKTPEQADDNG